MEQPPVDLLRFVVAGSVDDGKSTLLGRLLLGTNQIFEDQLAAVEDASRRQGFDYTNLALITDGLRAEREQGITIDVAYRYFTTAHRKFVVADTPGHVQYTRNMVTGSSNASVAVILVDARFGFTQQTRRHVVIASLLCVQHLVFCVNKMDLLGFAEAPFQGIRDEFRSFSEKLSIKDVTFVPVSALYGDNVTERSDRMPWYKGATLLHVLENVHLASDLNMIDARLPIQCTIRPNTHAHPDHRGFAGQIASGTFRRGDEVRLLPSGYTTTIAKIEVYGESVEEAFAPMAVAIQLSDALDLSRGDMVCRIQNTPSSTQDLDAMVFWLGNRQMAEGNFYLLKHTTRQTRARIQGLRYRLDIDTLHRDGRETKLATNEIGRVRLRATEPLFVDDYKRNRATGSFILIDEATFETVGAGMVVERVPA